MMGEGYMVMKKVANHLSFLYWASSFTELELHTTVSHVLLHDLLQFALSKLHGEGALRPWDPCTSASQLSTRAHNSRTAGGGHWLY